MEEHVIYFNCIKTHSTLYTVGRVDMFELDLRSRKPIYEQLVEKLKELIINEVLKPDEQLPSVRTLAQQLTINPNTIQKAYRELESQGYIYSVKGRGSFVNPSSHIQNAEKIMKVKEELTRLLSEALYLGITVEDLKELIADIEASVGGNQADD
jgi:GntR family transcriptional regulator